MITLITKQPIHVSLTELFFRDISTKLELRYCPSVCLFTTGSSYCVHKGSTFSLGYGKKYLFLPTSSNDLTIFYPLLPVIPPMWVYRETPYSNLSLYLPSTRSTYYFTKEKHSKQLLSFGFTSRSSPVGSSPGKPTASFSIKQKKLTMEMQQPYQYLFNQILSQRLWKI